MMYQQFSPGVRSAVFAVRMRLVSKRQWEHWDALAFALELAWQPPTLTCG